MPDPSIILAVQPHPDDVDLAVGGSVALWTAAGVRVVYVTVTDGAAGSRDPDRVGPGLAALRRREQEEAAHLLGVSDLLWLDYPDGGPIDQTALRDDLIAAIRHAHPDLVLVPDPWLPYEAHPDHLAVGMAGASAALLAHLPAFAPGRGVPFEVRETGFYFTAAPNALRDVTKVHGIKERALACHASQFTRQDAARTLEAQDARRGRMVEVLKVLPRTGLHVGIGEGRP